MRFATFVILLGAVACGNGSATPQPSPAPAPKPAGPPADANPVGMAAPQLFATFCAQCHGPEAKGYKADHAPSLVNPTFLESASNAYLTGSIERGRPGTSMAAYAKGLGGPLAPPEVEKLVQWLRSQGPQPKDLDSASLGDATKGQAIYAAQCQKCHGDQTTRGEYLLLANPRFLELASDAFIQHAIVNGRPGTPMEAFAQKLDVKARADVLAYVRSLAKTVTITQLPAPTGKEPIFINPKGKPPAFTMKEGRFVSGDQVKAALDKKQKLVIIDARPESDWMTVHITGAVSIPHYQLKRLDEIPKDAWIIAYCACPHHLSGIVVDELQKRGYKHAGVLDEGILDWQRRGFPIVAAAGAVTPPKEPSYPPGTIP
jgi:mono/diheme cytochrome c family protein/rhodanese-related sulfurtransferase